MPHKITVPRLGWSMETGVFGGWLKAAGEFVRAGEVVFLLEGEKAAQEIEALDSGVLCIPTDAPQPGADVNVGDVIGFLLLDGESAPASVRVAETIANLGSKAGAHAVAAPPAVPGDAAKLGAPSRATQPPSRRLVSTPRARRRAHELGVDWTTLVGTGRGGRIRESDVLAHQVQPTSQESTPTEPGKHFPATKLRQAIATHMSAGVRQAAPVTLTTKVEATALVGLRERRQAEVGGRAPSYNDLLVYLAARTLRELPALNACWHGDGVYVYDDIHVAIAVDTPSGLLAPVVRHADRLTLDEIADRTRELVAQARDGRLSQNRLAGGTFTITNLGMCGVDAFTPILNLPQAAILGVGRIVEEPVVRSGRLEVGRTMTLSLTFDHRAVDGAPAACWLQRLCQRIVSADAYPAS